MVRNVFIVGDEDDGRAFGGVGASQCFEFLAHLRQRFGAHGNVVGRFGREFRIHKFRTMAHDPGDRGPQLTVGLDARITRVGAFLRRTKLDELAQLFDVFEGTMSLVGPRPEVPRYVALYPAALREKVLSVRPGITDFASIEYRDESTLLARSADPERTYREVILPAKALFWNGPMGVFERPEFAKGSFGVAESLAALGATLPAGTWVDLVLPAQAPANTETVKLWD